MEAIAVKALRRIQTEGSPGPELAPKIEEALTLLGTPGGSGDADDYFSYFQACCLSGQPKIMELSLDAIHSLLQFGYLRGKRVIAATQIPAAVAATTTTEGSVKSSSSGGGGGGGSLGDSGGRRTLMDVIIECVCKCSDEFDDSVQLQTIKVLLTAVTSNFCDVNESSLLLAVRACFHIHLISKNSINKVTTKAALTQMVCAVLAKMESFESVKSSAVMPDTAACLADKDAAQFASVAHKDAFLLFRALCKLSMKGLHDDSNSGAQTDGVALQNKILSLELALISEARDGSPRTEERSGCSMSMLEQSTLV
jgi:brefeldin A-inhibited guanine nucleotide-exchange protein